MQKSKQLFILSAPIRSGKTSLLRAWTDSATCFGGFLSPDSLTGRILWFPSIKQQIPFELATPVSNCLSIGKFHFDSRAFELGINQAITDLKSGKKYILLDEIGKLELEHQSGFYQGLMELLGLLPSYPDSKLVFVVRDSLLDLAIDLLKEYHASVYDLDEFRNQIQARWIILAGGESKRMGSPKALLNYHGQAQYLYLKELLEANNQIPLLSLAYPNQIEHGPIECLYDLEDYEPCGPMSALLSYHNTYPLAGAYLIACDMPGIGKREIGNLLKSKSNRPLAPVSDFGPEPLFAFYPLDLLCQLEFFHDQGEQSLRRILEKTGFQELIGINPLALRSIDTQQQAQNWFKHE